MFKLNKKSIVSVPAILAILALGFMLIPSKSFGVTCGEGGCNYTYNNFSSPTSAPKADNPKPIINSLTPSSSNIGVGTKAVTILGEGFVPSSVARVNGANRSTTFIDNSHLLMQITGSDTSTYYTNGGFFVTVFNPAPGGGYSNTAYFTISRIASPAGGTSNNAGDTSTNFSDISEGGNGNSQGVNNSDLAASAILGSNSFVPSGLIQWIFFAILVLLVVILIRRVYGADEKYHAAPLKHD